MYKVFKVNLNNSEANVDLPEGFSVEGQLYCDKDTIVLLLYRSDSFNNISQQPVESPRNSNVGYNITSADYAYTTSVDALYGSGGGVASSTSSGRIR